ncbi:hypothetical protein [Chryseobacterium kimseyorum]|nr:hypothetical protein [Chryseobacterium kimseyorum]
MIIRKLVDGDFAFDSYQIILAEEARHIRVSSLNLVICKLKILLIPSG